MNTKTRNVLGLFILTILIVMIVIYFTNKKLDREYETPIKVGYLAITPNLSLYAALEEKLFEKEGLKIQPILFKSSNELTEALVTKRIDFATVTALSVLQSLEAASPGMLKIYQVNSIPSRDPNDFLLVNKDSKITNISELKGKKIGLYPGSNFNVWAKLIFGEYFKLGENYTTISLPPNLQGQSLATGSVDAVYCLEPTATILLQQGIAKVLDVGLVAKYIFDPFPVTGSAVLKEFVVNHQELTKKFCNILFQTSEKIEKNPDAFRKHLVKYCKISDVIANKVKLGHDTPCYSADVEALQKTVDIYLKHGIFKKEIKMNDLILYKSKAELE